MTKAKKTPELIFSHSKGLRSVGGALGAVTVLEVVEGTS
jgi:hypothetical protein